MALAPLAPWLNVSPAQFLEARQAGGTTGLGIANARQRAYDSMQEQIAREAALAARSEEAAKEQAFRRWELEMQLQAKSAAQAAEQAQAAAALDETRKYRLDQLGLNRDQLAEQKTYHQGQTELEREKNKILLEKAQNGEDRLMTPNAAASLLTDAETKGVDLEGTYGPGTTTNLANIVRSGIMPRRTPSPLTVQPDQVAALRQQAWASIMGTNGAVKRDERGVREKFKLLTGQNL